MCVPLFIINLYSLHEQSWLTAASPILYHPEITLRTQHSRQKKKVQINGLKLDGTASVCPVKILIERRYGMERKKGKEGSDRPYRLSALLPRRLFNMHLKASRSNLIRASGLFA